MIKTVRRRVRAHDQYQVEFRLDYELLPRARTRYQITTYIFVPQSLGIQADTYPKTDFYRDLQNYVRLKTPIFDLRSLSNASDSPLVLLQQLAADPLALNLAAKTEQFVTVLKFFRAIFKSSLRAQLRLLRGWRRSTRGEPANVQQVRQAICAAVGEVAAIAAQFRRLARKLANPQVNGYLLQSFRLMDESCSQVIEDFLVDLYRTVEQIAEPVVRQELKQCVERALADELAYRRAAAYPSLLDPAGDNEAYLFRTSVLKKFAASVLYLALTVKREGAAWEQLLFAGAAGLSMVFATVIAFYFQQRYGNFTFPFFMALVVGYMFKDRIKEAARILLAAALQRFIFDRRILIHTRDGKRQLGILREKVSFLKEEAVPRWVTATRNRNLMTELDNEGQAESILCYTKEVILRANAFRTLESGLSLSGITDIMRYDMRPYLRRMDDPVERKYYLQNGRLGIVDCPKVYYLNLISVYTDESGQREERLERHQIALTRKGIRRIERC
jgi:hypothetical protein